MKAFLRTLLALLTVGLIFTICQTAMASDLPETVRIGLFYGNTAKDTVTLSSPQGLYIYDMSFDNLVATVPESVTVSANSSSFMISGVGEGASENLLISPVNGRIKVNNTEYRGYIRLTRTGSQMTVVNVVKLEEYLYSVVGREMTPSWNEEALKAQAICARNYAANNLNKHSAQGFDLCGSTHCQAYTGVSAENPRTVSAVESTRGMVATYGGKMAELYFFSADGGSTEDCKNVWSADIPYLTGVADPYENTAAAQNGIWSVSFTPQELASKVTGIGTITGVQVKEYTPMGSVLSVEVTGTEGSKTFQKEKARTAFGLYSQKYTVTSAGGGISFVAQDGTRITGGEYAQAADGVYAIPSGSVSVVTANGVETIQNGPATGFTFSGQGWGHRVGMSQYGAKAMGEQGFTYDQILKFYFRGVEISQ